MHLRTYKSGDQKSSVQPKSSQFATHPFAVQAKPDLQTPSPNQNQTEALELQRKETQSGFDLATILLNTTPTDSSVIQPKLEIKRKTESNAPENSQISENSGATSINQRPLVARTSDSNSALPIQAKLSIGAANDKYEQEADRVASEVVQKHTSSVFAQAAQKKSLQTQEEPQAEIQAKPIISKLQRLPVFPLQREAMPQEDEELQTKSILQRQEAIGVGQASTELESSINSAKGSGQPLDAGLQQSMGQVMGADFSGVRVHTDAQSDQLNQSIQAKAFTTGQDVFFRQGAYDPGSRGGQELIAHELTHVVQQGGAAKRIQTNRQNKEIDAHYQVREPIIQKMTVAEGQAVVDTVKSFVPRAGNRLFDIIATLGKSIDKNDFTYEVLNSIPDCDFGTTDINKIATRASVAKFIKGAVCDNYQEMVIAEMDRRGLGNTNHIRGEHYKGHSYVSVIDPQAPDDRNQDLIVDAWRNIVSKRNGFKFKLFSKYRKEAKEEDDKGFKPHETVNNMYGTTDWQTGDIGGNTNLGEYWVRGYLNMKGVPDSGNLKADMKAYIKANPDDMGWKRLKYIYPI